MGRGRRLRRLLPGALLVALLAGSAAVAQQQEQVVRADLREWTLGFRTVEAAGGPVRFEVANVGQIPHGLVVEGAVSDRPLRVATEVLRPGQRVVLILTLPPGEYQVYCPEPGHPQAGMTGRLVVRGSR